MDKFCKRIRIWHKKLPQKTLLDLKKLDCVVLCNQFMHQWLQEIEELEIRVPQSRVNTCNAKDSVQGTVLRNRIKQYLSDNFPLRKALIRP